MALLEQRSFVGPLDVLKPLAASSGGRAGMLGDANEDATALAQIRLRELLPTQAVEALDTYFQAPRALKANRGSDEKPSWPLPRLLNGLCARTQDFRICDKAKGMQIGILSSGAPIDIAELGEQVEPDSTLCRPAPDALQRAAEDNASIEVRVFDRQIEDWAATADDIAAIANADIFMKLFIAGGTQSVNGWHRDTSDVVVTMLDGEKRFQVGPADASDDDPRSEVDAVLSAGDVLLLPRSRIHNATPVGGVSCLLSIGLMRMADWSYRSVSPTHLNMRNPMSPSLYRMALKPHTAPTREAARPGERYMTRIPGGVGLIEDREADATILAQGKLWSLRHDALDLLCRIHADGGQRPLQRIATMLNADIADAVAAASALANAGLIRRL